MSDVTRYDIEETSQSYDSYRCMMERTDGDFICSADYDSLKERLDEALRVLRRMVKSVERCKDLSVLDDEMREHASDARAVLKERP